MTIGERLKKIRISTQRPYHLFQYLGEEGGIMLVLEGEDPKKIPRLSFRGISIVDSIISAEKYIQKEINVGSMQPEQKIDSDNEEDQVEDIDVPLDDGIPEDMPDEDMPNSEEETFRSED